jgi:uncharacterized membrane protein YeaQ/YmgE (transglycosylase-associated protein family)
MTLIELVVYLVIAAIIGLIAHKIARGTGSSFVVSLLLGFLGAFLGTWLARLFRWPEVVAVSYEDHPFPIFWALVGAVVLVVLAHLLVRPRFVRRAVP